MKQVDRLYAIKDTEKNKLIAAKCGNGGKYYEKKHYAKTKIDQLNSRYNTDRYKLITFELKEI